MALVTGKNLFIGYSSVGSTRFQQLSDIELIKQDLLNHFYTKKNERVMMPGWGCGIWDYLFEPLVQVKDSIVYEAQQVVDSDPRVKLTSIDVIEFDHGIRINMVLYYVPLDAVDGFSIEFDRRSAEMF